jgi:cis-3-alkyl-4-acyloxetan-2-one decarboxylase
MKLPHELYPFEGRFLDRGGLRYHYLDEGQGETVVMVHGNPTWSFYYRDLVLALRDRYRCIVPDHIGCGLSDKPGDDRYTYTLKSRVDDLEALIEGLDLPGPITLVVHDWGGMIGLGYAARHPERIKRIVLLNTSGFLKPDDKDMPRALSLVRDWKLGSLLVRGFNAFAFGASRIGYTSDVPRAVRRAIRAPYDSWANRIATLRFVQDIPLKPGDPAWDEASRIEASLPGFADVPSMICWGEKDFVFDEPFLRTWIRLWPQAEVHRFPEAGHYVMEDAKDRIVPLVEAFLAAHPLDGGQPAR